MQLLLRNLVLVIAPSPRSMTLPACSGMSAPVTTALTPGSARARLGSIPLMRAWACGLRSIRPWSIPGRCMSAPYWACPVTFSVPSWRMGLVPTTLNFSVANTIFEAIGFSLHHPVHSRTGDKILPCWEKQMGLILISSHEPERCQPDMPIL